MVIQVGVLFSDHLTWKQREPKTPMEFWWEFLCQKLCGLMNSQNSTSTWIIMFHHGPFSCLKVFYKKKTAPKKLKKFTGITALCTWPIYGNRKLIQKFQNEVRKVCNYLLNFVSSKKRSDMLFAKIRHITQLFPKVSEILNF